MSYWPYLPSPIDVYNKYMDGIESSFSRMLNRHTKVLPINLVMTVPYKVDLGDADHYIARAWKSLVRELASRGIDCDLSIFKWPLKPENEPEPSTTCYRALLLVDGNEVETADDIIPLANAAWMTAFRTRKDNLVQKELSPEFNILGMMHRPTEWTTLEDHIQKYSAALSYISKAHEAAMVLAAEHLRQHFNECAFFNFIEYMDQRENRMYSSS